MKNVLFSFTVGIVVGYVLRKMEERGQLDHLCNTISDWADSSKRELKDAIDTAVNEAEYIEEQIEQSMN